MVARCLYIDTVIVLSVHILLLVFMGSNDANVRSVDRRNYRRKSSDLCLSVVGNLIVWSFRSHSSSVTLVTTLETVAMSTLKVSPFNCKKNPGGDLNFF